MAGLFGHMLMVRPKHTHTHTQGLCVCVHFGANLCLCCVRAQFMELLFETCILHRQLMPHAEQARMQSEKQHTHTHTTDTYIPGAYSCIIN